MSVAAVVSITIQCCPSYISNIVQNTAASSRRHDYVHPQTICHKLFRLQGPSSENVHPVSGPTAWNSLPNDIRKITHSNTFKRHLKFYFFNHYFYMEA